MDSHVTTAWLAQKDHVSEQAAEDKCIMSHFSIKFKVTVCLDFRGQRGFVSLSGHDDTGFIIDRQSIPVPLPKNAAHYNRRTNNCSITELLELHTRVLIWFIPYQLLHLLENVNHTVYHFCTWDGPVGNPTVRACNVFVLPSDLLCHKSCATCSCFASITIFTVSFYFVMHAILL